MMTRFRSLMYREIRICRKGIILNLLFLLLFAAMFWVGLLVLCSQELAAIIEETEANIIFDVSDTAGIGACLYMSFLGAMFGKGTGEVVFPSDLKTGWLNYSYALPITPFDRTLVRVVYLWLQIAINIIITNLNILGFCIFLDMPFYIGYISIQVILLDFMLVTTIINELFILATRSIETMKKQSEYSALIQLGLMLITVAVIIKKIGFNLNDFRKELLAEEYSDKLNFIEKMTGGTLLWAIPLMLLLIALHFAVVYYRLRFAYVGAGAKKLKTESAKKAVVISRTHDQPTGFLYKEIKQNKTGIILIALLPIFIIISCTLLSIVAYFTGQEFNQYALFEVVTNDLVLYCALVIGFFFASGILASVFNGDDKKQWVYFTVATPTGVKDFLYYKYALCFAMNGLYMVSWIFTDSLFSTVKYALTGKEASGMSGIILMIFYLMLFVCAIDVPFIVRYGAKKGRIIKLYGMILLAVIITLIIGFMPESAYKIIDIFVKIYKGEANDILMLLTSLSPLIVLAAYVLSYKISCRLFMKGAGEYDK